MRNGSECCGPVGEKGLVSARMGNCYAVLHGEKKVNVTVGLRELEQRLRFASEKVPGRVILSAAEVFCGTLYRFGHPFDNLGVGDVLGNKRQNGFPE